MKKRKVLGGVMRAVVTIAVKGVPLILKWCSESFRE